MLGWKLRFCLGEGGGNQARLGSGEQEYDGDARDG